MWTDNHLKAYVFWYWAKDVGLQVSNNVVWTICKESCENGSDTGKEIAIRRKRMHGVKWGRNIESNKMRKWKLLNKNRMKKI